MFTSIRSTLMKYWQMWEERVDLAIQANQIQKLIKELVEEHPNAPHMASSMCLFYDSTNQQTLRNTTLRIGKYLVGVQWGLVDADRIMAWVATNKGDLMIFDSCQPTMKKFLETGSWQTDLQPTLSAELDKVNANKTSRAAVRIKRKADLLEAAQNT